MNYDFSGMYYRLFCPSMIVIFGGILCLLIAFEGKKDRKGKKVVNRKNVWFSISSICFGLLVAGYYGYRIQLQDVKSFTGEYVSERMNTREAPPLPLTVEYTFEDSQGKERSFFLDVFSKKRIWMEDFEEGQEYVIYYDARARIIVAIEEVE